jgi:1-acyl-sn-glycerol-3-phosphate acyltransferase
MFDVPIVVIASPRPVTFMAQAGLFRHPFWNRFFRELGGFPVKRGEHGGAALATATAVLEAGGILGMFAEGTRNFGRGTGAFLPGAAWLALRTGAPILPCAIAGTALAGPPPDRWWKWLRRRDARVSFGPPIRVPPAASPAERRRQIPDVTARVREAVDSLLASMPSQASNAGGSGTLNA